MEEKEKVRQLSIPLREKDIWESLPERAREKAISLCAEMILQAVERRKEAGNEP